MQTEHLKVTGMTCNGCTTKVATALRAINGVKDVKVSLSGATATVQFDEMLASPQQLKSAVQGAGFGVDADKSVQSDTAKHGCCG